MKLTWFGGTALRAYVGGEIVVVGPDDAPATVDRGELLSGADRVVRFDDEIPVIDPVVWRPKRAGRAMDAAEPPDLFRIGERAIIVAGQGEPPRVLLGWGESPRYGRWADGAVIVLLAAGEPLVAEVSALLDVARPRIIALAADEQTLDRTIAMLAEHLDGTGLVSMEPGLALEV